MRRPDAWSRFAASVVAACLATFMSSTDEPPASSGPEVVAEARDNTVVVAGHEAAQAAGVDPGAGLVEYMRSDRCPAVVTNHGRGACVEELEEALVPDCGGEAPVPPLWRRERATATDDWSEWDRIAVWSCPQDVLPPLSQAEFRRLPIVPSVLGVQPDSPRVLVNIPTIVFTDPAVQSFTTTLLGYPVEVEATPSSFTWDFGDGSDPVTTTSPGHRYPNEDVAYAYPRVGVYTITLTTQFTGRYRVGGSGVWMAVTGTATTATTSSPIETVEAHSHLVADDCNVNPNGPYC